MQEPIPEPVLNRDGTRVWAWVRGSTGSGLNLGIKERTVTGPQPGTGRDGNGAWVRVRTGAEA